MAIALRNARSELTKEFDDRIFPVLTPLAVDPAHPFPYISNLSLNLAVRVHDPSSGDERFARVKVPPVLPRFFALPDGSRFMLLEDMIAGKLELLFPGMEILERSLFRVTREFNDAAIALVLAPGLALTGFQIFRNRQSSLVDSAEMALLGCGQRLPKAVPSRVPLQPAGAWGDCQRRSPTAHSPAPSPAQIAAPSAQPPNRKL